MTCKICGGSHKISTREHNVRSRNPQRRNLVIENLPVNECKICGHITIPESSQKMVSMLRESIRNQMVEIVTSEDEDPRTFQKIKNILKTWIG
jgi:YgiT-type zinc finger domain-containing protein